MSPGFGGYGGDPYSNETNNYNEAPVDYVNENKDVNENDSSNDDGVGALDDY